MTDVEPINTNKRKNPTNRVAKFALYCSCFLLVVTVANSLSFYFYVTSGGLNRIAANVWLYVYFMDKACSVIVLILLFVSLIWSPLSTGKINSLILTTIGIVIFICSAQIDSFVNAGFESNENYSEELRYWGHNENALKLIHVLINVIPRYCQKHDGRLPALDNWNSDFINTDPDSMNVLLVSDLDRFAFNENLAGLQLDQIPGGVVLLFEAERGENRVGSESSITAYHHYGKGSIVMFADLRVEFVKAEDFDKLRWKP